MTWAQAFHDVGITVAIVWGIVKFFTLLTSH